MEKGEFPTAWVDVETRWRYQRGSGEMTDLAKKLFGEANSNRAGVVTASLDAAKPIDDLKTRLKALCTGMDKAGDFYRHMHYGLFSYISFRIPEITDEVYRVDDAIMAGFGWEVGAFESWDVLGVPKTIEQMKKSGYAVAPWVESMVAAGHKTFYKVEDGKRLCYSPATGAYVGTTAPGQESAFIVMRNFEGSTVWKNSAANFTKCNHCTAVVPTNGRR
jgi:3-hydroxyacyl-CoA dehydrogenase